MRNLKRALSLALASVMLMGMMVVGSSAASFPDVSAEDNTEAIAVLEAVEVMIGNENGEFEPDKNVTRNEMAVILAKLILGKDADKYVGTCPFTDVPTWAQKYVAACYDNKIVAGRTESLYDGNAVVTAQEAAAMVLRVLGYEKLESTGTNWAQPVVAKANELRLFADVGSSANAPLNRNQVAQLSLNALQTTMVTSDVEQDIIVEGVVTIPGKVTYTERTTNKFDYTQSNGTYVKDTSDEKLQLCENLYEKDLCLVSNGEKDAFGRPSSTWVYNDKDIYSVAETADKTYIGGVKAKDIYKDLGLSAEVAVAKIALCEDTETAVNGTQAINSTNGEKYGKDGQTVYVYYDKDADKPVSISIISTYLGVVVDEDFTEDDKDGMRVEVFGVGTKFFEATGYKEGDLLLVTVSDTDIQEIIGEPETVTGEVTRVGSDDALTLDGDKYAQSTKFDGDADGDAIKGVSTFTVENSYTLYLDRNGCYLAAELDEDNATTDLVYVYDVKGKLAVSNGTGDYKPVATVVKMDGTIEHIALGDKGYSSANEAVNSTEGAAAVALKQKLADLIYDEDDKVYSLAASGDYASVAISAGSDIELKDDSRYAKLNGSTNAYLNNETVYVFVEENDDHDDVKDAKVITGGVNFTINSGITKSAYAVETGKTTAKYVVIMAPYEAANKDIVYIKDGSLKGTVKGGFTFEGYYGTDSKKVELPIYSVGGTAVVKGTTSTYPTQGFYTYIEKADGTLKLTAASGSNVYTGKAITSLENGLLSVATGAKPYITDGVTIVDLTDKADAGENAYGSNVTTLSALSRVVNMTSTEYTVTVDIYVNSDDEVVALFIKRILEDDGIINEGTKAKMTAALNFSGAAGGQAPEWKSEDTVQFTSSNGTENLDLTFKYTAARSNGWTKSAGTVPTGWTADFNGTTLTLEQENAADLDTNPFGTVATVVTANNATVSGVTVGAPSWTPGEAGGSEGPDPEPADPTVTGVTVSAADNATSVTKGGTLQFNATVEGENNPAQTVTWSITTTGVASGTSISETGLLTVAANETKTSIEVKATSTVDTTKSGTKSVTVEEDKTQPTVTSVTVSAADDATSVTKGQTLQFNATVEGTNNPDQTVTWSIKTTGVDNGTTINSSGLLTVASGETQTSIEVEATSTVDTSKSGTKSVTVSDATA